MFKFIHAADIHLDSPLRGLEAYDGAPAAEIRQATRRALENLVRLALAERAQFVLIAGDLYDGDWRHFNTGLFFTAQMAILREAGIRVFLVSGNHDAANRMTRRLKLPDNVHLFSAERPATVTLDDLGVAIHGQSFARAAVTEDLSARYPAALPGCLNIGLIHTCATGGEGHEPYAPCTLEGLRAHGYDYWALGHIHRRAVLHDDPPIVFPGNPQGRHIREAGARGCTLVTVEGGRATALEHRPLDVFRWEPCAARLDGQRTLDDALGAIEPCLSEALARHPQMPLALRLELAGPAALHRQFAARAEAWEAQIRALALELSGGAAWIEKVLFAPSAQPAPAEAAPPDGAIGELLEYVQRLCADDAELVALAAALDDLAGKLPAELKDYPERFDLADPALLRQISSEARELLAERLAPVRGDD